MTRAKASHANPEPKAEGGMERADEGAMRPARDQVKRGGGSPRREARDERERGAHRFGPVEVTQGAAGRH